MSEYITVWVDDLPDLKRKEEITRCRDCKHYRESDMTCHSWQWHNWDAPVEVDADGYCAWGERRES